jgi:Predicted exonuclease
VVDADVTIVSLPMDGAKIRSDQLAVMPIGDSSNTTQNRGPSWETDTVCLLGTELELDVKPYARETSLTGVTAYQQRLPENWITAATAHLSTQLRTGFKTSWSPTATTAPMDVIGVGTSATDLGAGANGELTDPAVVDVYSNGAISVETIDPERFGLRGIHAVGRQRLQTLSNAGITTVQKLAETPLTELMDLQGFGRTTARNIYTRACAQASETVQHLSGGSLPSGKPVFIDIETDGLNPSTAWLIGVLDGGPDEGRYLTFRENTPGGTEHIDAFLSWVTGPAAGRPIVAWNGYNFDFPVLIDQIQTHYPDRVSEWEQCYQFDAYWWAVRDDTGHVALPGRTNALEDVAEALGWERSTTGIDGQTVAEIYTAYRRNCELLSERRESDSASQSVAEPDWDRLEAYCEDDVRALATIYAHLADVVRRDATDQPRNQTTQGSLADFT